MYIRDNPQDLIFVLRPFKTTFGGLGFGRGSKVTGRQTKNTKGAGGHNPHSQF